MKQVLLKIEENTALNSSVMRLRLKGDCSAISCPGQFVNIKLDSCFLRRPLSVCDCEGDSISLIYRISGKGTSLLAGKKDGELDVLTGLGNGFDTKPSGDKPLLIGGGTGISPLYMLAKKLICEGKSPTVIMGFAGAEDIVLENEFSALGIKTAVTTADGSYGIKGFVTEAMDLFDYSYFYACGPEAMLKAVYDKSTSSGQFSFEERMGCGFGACMGCTCQTLAGPKRICRDGPVLIKEELLW